MKIDKDILFSIYVTLNERTVENGTNLGPRKVLTFSENTLGERVTGVTDHTSTHRGVADNVTVGVRTARADARILALLIDTGQLIGTLAVTNASRSAIRWAADEARQTRAEGQAVARSALRVGPANGRFARRGRRWLR